MADRQMAILRHPENIKSAEEFGDCLPISLDTLWDIPACPSYAVSESGLQAPLIGQLFLFCSFYGKLILMS